jgi:hypothetical protein
MRGVTVQVRSGAGGTTRTPRTKKIWKSTSQGADVLVITWVTPQVPSITRRSVVARCNFSTVTSPYSRARRSWEVRE